MKEYGGGVQGDTGASSRMWASTPAWGDWAACWWEAGLGRWETPATGNTGSADCGTQFLAGDSLGGHVVTVPSSSCEPETTLSVLGSDPTLAKACPMLARHLEGREEGRR